MKYKHQQYTIAKAKAQKDVTKIKIKSFITKITLNKNNFYRQE